MEFPQYIPYKTIIVVSILFSIIPILPQHNCLSCAQEDEAPPADVNEAPPKAAPAPDAAAGLREDWGGLGFRI